LFQLFRFYTEIENFGVLIEAKQTEEQPKQFDREYNLVFFIKLRVVSVCLNCSRFVLVCFKTVLFVSVPAAGDEKFDNFFYSVRSSVCSRNPLPASEYN
jgi:hypothetical protein